MQKTTAKRILAVLLGLALVLPVVSGMSAAAETNDEIVWLYSESFDQSSFDELAAGGLWKVENTSRYSQG